MMRKLSAVLVAVIAVTTLAACQYDHNSSIPTNTRPTVPVAPTTGTTNPTTVPTSNFTTVPTSHTTRPSSDATVPSSNKVTTKPSTTPSGVPTTPTTVAELTLPYKIPNTGLILEQVAPYDGIYVEDGSNSEIQGVAMILLRNFGKHDIELATITLSYGKFTREFVVSSLPAGMSVVVQEKNRNPMGTGKLTGCSVSVIESNRDSALSDYDISVTEMNDNAIVIENLTRRDFPSVRLYYKYFMEDQQLLVGGITFTVNVTDLKAGQSVTIKPSHYLKGASCIVMAQTYEESA
jgi:hypothetical protein